MRTFDADLTTVMRRVEAGDVDLAIGVFTPASGIERVPLFRFSFIFIRSGDDAAVRRSSTTWSAAASEALIALPPTSPVQRRIDRELRRAGVRRGPAMVVNALDTQIAMVEAGEGVAIIPSFGLPVCRNRNVAMSRLVSPAVGMDFHEIRARGRTLPPAAEEFAAFLEPLRHALGRASRDPVNRRSAPDCRRPQLAFLLKASAKRKAPTGNFEQSRHRRRA